MSDVVLLRTLARKSIMTGGPHEGLSVQMIINMGRQWRLAYTYFRYGMLSFLPDILDELGITEQFRIDKPGSDLEMFEKWKAFQRETRDDSETEIMARAMRSRGNRNHNLKRFERSTNMSKNNIRNKHRKLST